MFVDRFPILKLGGAALKELLKDLKRFYCLHVNRLMDQSMTFSQEIDDMFFKLLVACILNNQIFHSGLASGLVWGKQRRQQC